MSEERKRQTRSRYVDYGGKTDKYEWDQWEDEVLITVKFPPETKGKDIICEIKHDHLKLGKKGEPFLIDGPLYQEILPDESTWTFSDGVVEIHLSKATSSADWWKCVIVGDPEIDVRDIEGSKYLDDSLLKKIKEKKEEEKKKKEEEEKKKKEEQNQQKSEEETK